MVYLDHIQPTEEIETQIVLRALFDLGLHETAQLKELHVFRPFFGLSEEVSVSEVEWFHLWLTLMDQ